MARKKRYRGHYCYVCGEILPNEKFTGKGHVAHICKKCARLTPDNRLEAIALTHICRTFKCTNLSRQNRLMFEKYTHSKSERVRQAAVDALSGFAKGFAVSEPADWYVADDVLDVVNEEIWDNIDDDIPF